MGFTRAVILNLMVVKNIERSIEADLGEVVKKNLGLILESAYLEQPADPSHGDIASTFALAEFRRILQGEVEFSTPLEVAQLIVEKFPEREYLQKVEAVAPGFINFYISDRALLAVLESILSEKGKYGSSSWGEGAKVLLEHTSPDPIKALHVGHLRNNFLGMAVGNLLEFSGFDVTLDCVVNDRGTHVCRVMWGYLFGAYSESNIDLDRLLNFSIADSTLERLPERWDWEQLLDKWVEDSSNWLTPDDIGLKSDYFYLLFYALGDRAEKEVPGVKASIRKILQAWESNNLKVKSLWKMIITQSLVGQDQTYSTIGSRHDHVWYESALYEEGKDLVSKGLEEGVFQESEGAVITNLSEYNLPDTVVIKSDGTSLYHTFDINLTKKKREKFPSDLYMWVIANDQILYMKQLFAICEQLGIGTLKDYLHLYFGYVYLKGGERMRSREGSVVTADYLLNAVGKKVCNVMESSNMLRQLTDDEKEDVIQQVTLAAVKYGLLRYSREKDINFNIDTSVSLEGDSGPYVQYACTRAESILDKAGVASCADLVVNSNYLFCKEAEQSLLRCLSAFPRVVKVATETYEPQIVCSYLFDLARRFNKFYEKVSVINSTGDDRDARLALVFAAAQVMKNGLGLLGISLPHSM